MYSISAVARMIGVPGATLRTWEGRYALVVVELLISGGAGFSLCRFFKQDRDVPVIAVSVLECQAQAIEAGADAFLPKPLEPLRFVSTVRELLGSSVSLLVLGRSPPAR